MQLLPASPARSVGAGAEPTKSSKPSKIIAAGEDGHRGRHRPPHTGPMMKKCTVRNPLSPHMFPAQTARKHTPRPQRQRPPLPAGRACSRMRTDCLRRHRHGRAERWVVTPSERHGQGLLPIDGRLQRLVHDVADLRSDLHSPPPGDLVCSPATQGQCNVQAQGRHVGRLDVGASRKSEIGTLCHRVSSECQCVRGCMISTRQVLTDCAVHEHKQQAERAGRREGIA